MPRPSSTTAWLLFVAIACLGPASVAVQEHVGQYSQAAVLRGSQVYLAQCAVCHGLAGNTVPAVDLRAGRFKTAISDDDLKRVIRTGAPTAGMPPMKLDDEELTAVVAFIRAGMGTSASALQIAIGDAARGRAIVRGKGECLRCHRIHDQGARSAPDLSGVGSSRSPAMLHLSLIDPTRAMLPMNRPVRIVTREGKIITGRRLNEDTYTVQVADEDGRLRSLEKSELRELQILTTSPMPSYKDTLTREEIADVFAYLLSLKDPTLARPRR